MRYQSARDKNDNGLPIVALDFAAGLKVASLSTGSTQSDVLAGGAYLLTATKDSYISASGSAGNTAGSTFLAAGMPFHILLAAGSRVHVRAVEGDASLFILPLA